MQHKNFIRAVFLSFVLCSCSTVTNQDLKNLNPNSISSASGYKKNTSKSTLSNSGSVSTPSIVYSTTPTTTTANYANPTAASSSLPMDTIGVTSDIKENTTFNGKVFDKKGGTIDDAIVTAKSVDPAVTWTGETQKTVGGSYVFRNAPVGARIEITVTKDGISRTRTEVLKSNLTGDPKANVFEFGSGNNANGTDPNNLYAIPDPNAIGDNSITISYDYYINFTPDTLITVEYSVSEDNKKNTVSRYYREGEFTIKDAFEYSDVKITIKKPDGTETVLKHKIYNKKENKIQLNKYNFSVLAINEENNLNPDINKFIDTVSNNLSTFSIDVDTASYTLMRSSLTEQNKLPERDSVRTEEYLNFFDYKYPQPENDLFNIITDIATSPVGDKNRKLLRIGLKSKDIETSQRKKSILTFVIDISGSMSAENRLPAVKKSLEVLVNNLKPDDKIGIVVFGSNARIALEHKSIQNKEEIIDVIRYLDVEGSTNTESGLKEGFKLASKNYDKNANNRVILCSDGIANVGISNADKLANELKSYNEGKIPLTTIGFGIENYNDALMETLANKTDGYYAYVDNIQEAYRVFLENLNGTLQNFARDVKIQVDFDKNIVKRYRLLGYENRKLNNSDFRNDSVDAGDIGINSNVTALYELELNNYDKNNKIGDISLRYKKANLNSDIKEQTKSFYTSEIIQDFNKTSNSFKLASSVAMYAEILKGSYWSNYATFEDVINLSEEVQKNVPNYDDFREFVYLAKKASNINGKGKYYYRNTDKVSINTDN